MKQKKLMLFASALTLAASISLFTACKKNDSPASTTTATEDTEYASDQTLAERMYQDAQTMSEKGESTTGSGEFKMTSSCGTVTHSGSTYTIDFGTVNCLCADGRYRRGKIIVNYSGGGYADSGSVHTITFDGYYQNDNKIEGTKTVTNMGHNAAGHPWFQVTVNGTVIKSTGVSIGVDWTRNREWTAGYTTHGVWSDDVYSVTGSGTITRTAGTMTATISATAPLIIALNCNWIEAGTITYTFPSGLSRSLNYGDTPVCDNVAVLTLATGTTRSISLP